MGYSLQSNVKSLEGVSPPERDSQFRYINRQVKKQIERGEPVLSIDTKKKERVGRFKNSGKRYRRKGEPEEVNVYDYPYLGEGTAIPYGATKPFESLVPSPIKISSDNVAPTATAPSSN